MDRLVDEEKEKKSEFNKGVAIAETELFSNVLGRDIKLVEDDTMPTSATDGKTIYINPNSPIVTRSGDFHTMLNHEQAHILFKSNKYIPEILKEKFKNIPPQTIFTVYNILEDMRIEANWSKVFEGSKEGFEHLKKKTIVDNPTNPIEVLATIRADKPELIKNSSKDLKDLYESFKEKTKLLDGASFIATFPIESEILEEMEKWYKKEEQKNKKENKKKEQKDENKEGNGGSGDKNEEEKKERNGGNKSKNEEEKEQKKENKEGNGGSGDNEEKKKIEEDTKEYIKKDKSTQSEMEKVEEQEPSDISKEMVEDKLKRFGILNDDGTFTKNFDIKNLEKEEEFKTDEEDYTKLKIEKHYDKKANIINGDINKEQEEQRFSAIEIPFSTIPKLKSILNTLNQREIESEEYSGRKVNMKRLMEKIANPEKDVKPFDTLSDVNGTDFWVMLDLSGSMFFDSKIDNAKEALAKIYDTIKSSKSNIKIKMFGFTTSSEKENNKPLIFEFDRKRLNTLRANGYTPTADAVKYINEKFKKVGNAEKNLIIITDGLPYNHSHNFIDYIKKTKEEIQRIKRNNVNVFTIFIGDRKEEEDMVKNNFKLAKKTSETLTIPEIYGSKTSKDIYTIKNSEDIEPILTNIFKKDIMRKIRA